MPRLAESRADLDRPATAIAGAEALGPPLSPGSQHEWSDAVPGRRFGEFEIGYRGQEFFESDRELTATQIRADASMHTDAEREMRVHGSIDEDGVGIFELLGVPVSGTKDECDPFSGTHRHAPELGVFGEGPSHRLDW